ncbi:MAG TPA: aminotransferase class V-fold PLP-dependent enzyme [Gaiellaceae bacterium]|nr:aminotransferase class V-fold PLP-dependent enzyme [Gaiellaceae bacterium]
MFLNHGSFGACPRPVFDEYQRWQRELERRPVEFLARRFPDLIEEATARLADFVGARPDDLVFVPNATSGMNVVARSLQLGPRDEVLLTNHEYGAVDLLWEFVCGETGATLVRQPVEPGPELVDELWSAVTERTRLVSVSHITSATGLLFPVDEICRRAREQRILTAVDGAHAPGQVDLDLDALGADFYAGNCHKWLCAPKGAGFLHVRPEHQAWLAPQVVGWGEAEGSFAARHRWQGTRDPAAYLAVPTAIDFLTEHDWPTVREPCAELTRAARLRLAELTGMPPLAPDPSWIVQMVAAELPACDCDALKARLYDEHRIEIPVKEWDGHPLIRASFQGYNDESDLEALAEALATLAPWSSS